MATEATNPDGSTRFRTDQLPRQAALAGWPTPVVNDAKGSGYSYSQGDKNKPVLKLPGQAQQAGWPTPNATDSTGAGRQGREGGANLQTQAAEAGPMRLTASGDLLTGSSAGMAAGGQLSPHMSRWLMGFPLDWCEAALRIPKKKKRK
jgi:hypothetical protein